MQTTATRNAHVEHDHMSLRMLKGIRLVLLYLAFLLTLAFTLTLLDPSGPF